MIELYNLQLTRTSVVGVVDQTNSRNARIKVVGKHSVTKVSKIVEILKIKPMTINNKNAVNCILQHNFSLFKTNLALFHNFFLIFTKKFNNFKKCSGHTRQTRNSHMFSGPIQGKNTKMEGEFTCVWKDNLTLKILNFYFFFLNFW